MSDYRVTTEVFEGPLDLLLTLVRREALDITAIALARVTDGYLRYLASLEAVDPGALAAFIDTAATLLVIKSRALLPQAPRPVEDEPDEAEDLLERLRAFRQYRQTAEVLGARERSGLRAFARVAPLPDIAPALQPGEASVTELAGAFEQAMAEALARAEAAPAAAVRPRRLRLADRMVAIRSLLDQRRQVGFREVLLGEAPARDFVIVSFLAVLELLRRAVVRARQAEVFGEIVIELRPEIAGTAWSREELTAGVADD